MVDSAGVSRKCKIVIFFAGMFSTLEIITVRKWEYQKTWEPYQLGPCRWWKNTSDCFANEMKAIPSSIFKPEQNNTDWKEELARRLEKAEEKKIILIWISMFGSRTKYVVNRNNCGNCDVTYDREMINDNRTGAVLFHFHAIKADDVPKTRNPKQLHIFWDKESSASLKTVRGRSLQFEESYEFNATMTFRINSDFWNPYRSPDLADKLMGKNESVLREIISTKTKLAMAIVSDCTATPGASARLKLIKQLSAEGLNIDAYGKCFGKRMSNQDFQNAISSYKFFISFENSYHCKEYITEKFFIKAIQNRVVPIAWGATKEDYDAVAPPGSYIFAEDFKTMKDLVKYIKYVNQSDEEYTKYIRWMTLKPEALPMYERSQDFCSVCRALHGINIDDIYRPDYDADNPIRPLFTDGMANRTVPSLIDWFYTKDNKECFGRNIDVSELLASK